jgi:hypothetical protein
VAGLVAVALACAGLSTAAPARAAKPFTGKAANPAIGWAAASYFTCQAAVTAANPWLYYRLNETGGSTAADSSGNGRTGSYSGSVTFGAGGACAHDSGKAVTLNGSGAISSNTTMNNPTTYSVETWFKTTTTTGGKLIGFGNATTGLSVTYDRHVYMTNSGQLVFGTYSGVLVGTYSVLTTSTSYRDGNWHLLDATQSAAGMRLYVDGALIASNAVATAQNQNGYWRIGGDNVSGWPSAPTSNYFTGSLDEAAVYASELTAAQIAAHYNAAA